MTAAHAPGGRRALPRSIARPGGDTADGSRDGLRERVVDEVNGALRAREAVALDAWLNLTDPAAALQRWFGTGICADQRWLLLALERDIAAIDALLAAQVNAMLHTPAFQRLEARWRGLWLLTDVAELSPLAKLRLLPISWSEIVRDLDRAGDFDRSQLFQKIYTEEIGTLGGEPFGLLIGDYEIQHRPTPEHPSDDIATVKSLAMIAAAAFAPLVMGVAPSLLQLESFSALGGPVDVRGVFRQSEYQRWHAMRDAEETRFVGLVLPRVLMRRPYVIDSARRDGFRFAESVGAADAGDYLWGNGAIAFGCVVLRAFATFGWFADIRGAARDDLRGGLVVNLPPVSFATDADGVAIKPSIEALLSDTQEKDLADLGFIALRKVPFSEYSVFYSNQSIHSPPRYDRPSASVNARLSAMLQYMLCVSRFAHYVKLQGRQFIGTMRTADEVQAALSKWLFDYVTSSDDISQDSKARFPLRDAKVEVKEVSGKAGVYACVLFLRPHFQLDDIGIRFPSRRASNIMTIPNDLQTLLRNEKLEEAIAHLNAEVRNHPTAIDRRAQLAELLCITGNLDRADTVLNAITDIDPGAMVGVALFRQLVRAAQARQQFFSDGRLPEFVVKPDAVIEIELRAAIALREGAWGELAKLIAERDEARMAVAGTADGETFDDFRDLDDLAAAHLEVFTSTGKYFWIPIAAIESIELRKPESQRDLLWRRALVSVADGPDGEVYLPTIYCTSEPSAAQRLGHVTDFENPTERVSLGRGLRTFLVGEESRSLRELGRVAFAAHATTTS